MHMIRQTGPLLVGLVAITFASGALAQDMAPELLLTSKTGPRRCKCLLPATFPPQMTVYW